MPTKTKPKTKKKTEAEEPAQSATENAISTKNAETLPGTNYNPIRSTMADLNFHLRERILIRCPECGETHAKAIFGWKSFVCQCSYEIRHPSFYSSGAPSHGSKTRVFSINLSEDTISKLETIAAHHGTRRGGFIRFLADLVTDACHPLDRMIS